MKRFGSYWFIFFFLVFESSVIFTQFPAVKSLKLHHYFQLCIWQQPKA